MKIVPSVLAKNKKVHLFLKEQFSAPALRLKTKSGLADKPIRWILDDARKFIQREIKRGRKYDGIILDPPAFGHGPNKELWKIEDDLLPLLKMCHEVMTPDPLFFLINGYASGYSAIAYENNLRALFKEGNFQQRQ